MINNIYITYVFSFIFLFFFNVDLKKFYKL